MSISRKRLTPEESRSAAIEAARRILLEHGPQAVTLKAVAAEVGRTHANLLHHFGSAAGLQGELARSIADAGWRQFRTLLESKALMYGRTVNVISTWEPTSQRCSACGQLGGKKHLNIRAWTCLHCGAEHDRDINAANNIAAA